MFESSMIVYCIYDKYWDIYNSLAYLSLGCEGVGVDIDFGVDPIGNGVGVTFFCLHNIL